MAERIIGVDFGTSTSVIRVKRYENGTPIGEKLETKEVIFGGNGAMVPTLIMKKDDDPSVAYYGYEAQQKKRRFTTFQSFKVDLESADGEKRTQARELTEEFFAYLGKQYRTQSDGGHLGSPDDKARTIISYPVKWSEETKQFMLEAAKKAGFPNVTGMDEAQAAIQAVTVMSTDHLKKNGLLVNGKPANILLIDMGAGTTDLVLCRYTPGAEEPPKILSTWPKSGKLFFGGKEIDALLKNFFWDKLDEEDARQVFQRIGTDKFKSWKENTVSPALWKKDSVSDFEVLDSCVEMMGIDMDEYCLNRAAFEECLKGYLKQFPILINGCIQDAGVNGSDVDLVIVTGGHSQWYFVQEMLSGKMERFGKIDLPKIREDPVRIIPISRPQETVALGLVYGKLTPVVNQPDTHRAYENHSNQRQLAYSAMNLNDGFYMSIQDVFPITGRGVVVTGRIMKSKVSVGQKISIVKDRYNIVTASVVAIEMFHKLLDYAEEGDDVGLLLSDNIRRSDVKRGQVIVAPGAECQLADSFVGTYWMKMDTEPPGSSALSVKICVNETLIPAQISITEGYPRYPNGDVPMQVKVHMSNPTVLYSGTSFGIVYRESIIGYGRIDELQNVFFI